MIRRAEIADAPTVAAMGLQFIEAAKLPRATLDDCVDFCRRLISDANGVAFLSDRGVIAGYISPLYYRPDFLQAYECFWWSEDGSGLQLLSAFEQWAESHGVRETLVSSLADFSDPVVEKLFMRRGYELRENNFVLRGKT